MYRKLLLIFVVAVLAWCFGPLLSEIVSWVPFKGEAATSLWYYLIGQDGEFYIHFFFWAVVFWFLLPVLLSLFGFVTPQARRFSTTKLLRRSHWITAQLAMLSLLFLLSSVVLNLLGFHTTEREAVRLAEKEMKRPPARSEKGRLTSGLLKNQKELDFLLFGQVEPECSRRLTNYLNSLKNNLVVVQPEWYRVDKDYAFDIRLAIDRENVRRKKLMEPSGAATDSILRRYLTRESVTNSTGTAPYLLKAPVEYVNLRTEYVEMVEATTRSEADIRSTMQPGGQFYEAAHAAAKRTISHWSVWRRSIVLTAPYYWPVLLASSFVLLIFGNLLFKPAFSRAHHVVMRFVEEGRFGQGGSGRFAGLFEEWGLISFHRGTTGHLQKTLSRLDWIAAAKKFGTWIENRRSTIHKARKPELFMGRSLHSPFLHIGLADDRHMLTVAGSRTGKGATAIIPNLLLWEGSAIVIDPKGTNAAVTAEHRRRMGHKVHLVDPFGIVEKDESRRASFNPLEGLNPDGDTIREDINVIADALVVPDPEQKDRHWDDGAGTILGGMIGQLISDPEIKQPSLPMLRDLLSLPQESQDELWASMMLNPGAGGAPKDAASRVIRGGQTNEISGLVSNADKHSEWLSYPAMQRALSHSTFSFAELKEQPTTVYLILPPNYLATHNRFLRLFINIAILKMAEGGRSKIPVLMILDEFLALGHMAEVEKAFGLMAGYNLILWPFVQDLGRLKDLYKRSVNSFIANSRAVQIFGVADVETTEFVSKQMGNSSPSLLATHGFSTSVPLRGPDEVAKDIVADSQRQYILRAGKAPLVLEKVAYHNGGLLRGWYPGLFAGKFGQDPDH